ncbi:hypothetical protein Y032_0085g1825 [Ancylostoma ceylanicum]|uniref:Schlafen AlbA-2 domain-containing protein n=1 Tax=Ancylostoma ceylanicum TaxID=53326 RepID=A0A016TPY8_9BILA|nr:hypothetical protein Y032_0085g1825 [Ancylostoma ceylanicum]
MDTVFVLSTSSNPTCIALQSLVNISDHFSPPPTFCACIHCWRALGPETKRHVFERLRPNSTERRPRCSTRSDCSLRNFRVRAVGMEDEGFERAANETVNNLAFVTGESRFGDFFTEGDFTFEEENGPNVLFDGERNSRSGPRCDGIETLSETSSADIFPELGEQANCKAPHEKRDRDAFGRSIPKYRTAWRIVPNQPCVNYYVLSAEVVPSSEKKCEPVQLPAELVLTLEDMHCRELQGSQKVFEKLFSGKPKQYICGDTFKPAPDTWTLFWDPYRLAELTTLTIQSTICAALNSRRHLSFIIGIGQNNEVIGCELSQKERDTMKELFQLCVSTEFVPPLEEDLVAFRFHPVYDQNGCEIPSRFLAEISIKDKVATLFQLSSGRIYYADGNVVVRTRTFSDARRMLFLRRQAELKEALKDPARRLM